LVSFERGGAQCLRYGKLNGTHETPPAETVVQLIGQELKNSG